MKFFALLLVFINSLVYANSFPVSCEYLASEKVKTAKEQYLGKFKEGSSEHYEISLALNNINVFVKETEDNEYLKGVLSFKNQKLFNKRKKTHNKILNELFDVYQIHQEILIPKEQNCHMEKELLPTLCAYQDKTDDIMGEELEKLKNITTALLIQESIESVKNIKNNVCVLSYSEYLSSDILNEIEFTQKDLENKPDTASKDKTKLTKVQSKDNSYTSIQNSGQGVDAWYKGILLNIDLSNCSREPTPPSNEIEIIAKSYREKKNGKDFLTCNFFAIQAGQAYRTEKELATIDISIEGKDNCKKTEQGLSCSKEIDNENKIQEIEVEARSGDQSVYKSCFDDKSFPRLKNVSTTSHKNSDGKAVCDIKLEFNEETTPSDIEQLLNINYDPKNVSGVKPLISKDKKSAEITLEMVQTDEKFSVELENRINGKNIKTECDSSKTLSNSVTLSHYTDKFNGAVSNPKSCRADIKLKTCANGEKQQVWQGNCSPIPCLEDGGGWNPNDVMDNDRCEFTSNISYCSDGTLANVSPFNCKVLGCGGGRNNCDPEKYKPIQCNDGKIHYPITDYMCVEAKCPDIIIPTVARARCDKKDVYKQCPNGKKVEMDYNKCEFPKCEVYPVVSVSKRNRKCLFEIENKPMLNDSKLKYYFDEEEMTCDDESMKCTVDDNYEDSEVTLFIEYDKIETKHKCKIAKVKKSNERTRANKANTTDADWFQFDPFNFSKAQSLGYGSKTGFGNPYFATGQFTTTNRNNAGGYTTTTNNIVYDKNGNIIGGAGGGSVSVGYGNPMMNNNQGYYNQSGQYLNSGFGNPNYTTGQFTTTNRNNAGGYTTSTNNIVYDKNGNIIGGAGGGSVSVGYGNPMMNNNQGYYNQSGQYLNSGFGTYNPYGQMPQGYFYQTSFPPMPMSLQYYPRYNINRFYNWY